MTSLKKGDRVRCTLGENVLVGVVVEDAIGWIYMTPGGATRLVYLDRYHWTIEVIALPIPEVDGTIVVDTEGQAWQRGTDYWFRAGSNVAWPLSDIDSPVLCQPVTQQ